MSVSCYAKFHQRKLEQLSQKKNVNKIAENSSAFDYAKEAFKALDNGPG